jgi:hypothetical protein
VWLIGDHKLGLRAKIIYAHHCFIAWKMFQALQVATAANNRTLVNGIYIHNIAIPLFQYS